MLMMSWMVAFATPEVPTDTEAPAAVPPAAVRTVPPSYPAVSVAEDVKCAISLSVDAEGLPTVLSVEGCPEAFAESSSAAVAQWRFEDGKPGTLIVRTVFKPASGSIPKVSSEQKAAILAAHSPTSESRTDGGPCAVAVDVMRSGDVAGLQSNDLPDCLLMPAGGGRAPGKVWKRLEGPTSCVVTFQATEAGPEALAAAACPDDLFGPTRVLAHQWAYNLLDAKKGTTYELTVTYRP